MRTRRRRQPGWGACGFPLVITPLGELELANAFQLRRFRKEIGNREARAAWAAFHADLRNGVVLMRDIPEDGFSYALRLVQKWTAKLGTRSLDIIHIAAATALRSDTFLTFDERQRKLARAARLAIT